ncbi:Winged helix-turn-helix DNA-binding domain [Lasallia pustulata]|uniref:Winged helix-turn-helix DNA-binding domain n=1 Tax=Lasallia pustulata TaxID=136370 RepID=A0A1W5D6U0_9LECA|nr:Winged helix-turn-helix DNA-binding domain [Lasallia pustulata]
MPSGGSHPRYTDEVRNLIQDSVTAGARTCDIASYLRVSDSMVSRLRGFYETFGTVSPAHPGVQGRPRKIHKEAEEGVIDFLDEYPTARQDEVCDFLADEYDIHTTPSSVCRLFKRLQFSSKLVERQHGEQDPLLRASYLADLTQYSADQLIYVDESASNERTRDRKYVTPQTAKRYFEHCGIYIPDDLEDVDYNEL